MNDTPDDSDPQELEAQMLDSLLDQMVAKLSEYCSSVRIFVTTHNGGKELSTGIDTGGGNIYAQLGQVREWLLTQDEYVRVKAREDAEEEDED